MQAKLRKATAENATAGPHIPAVDASKVRAAAMSAAAAAPLLYLSWFEGPLCWVLLVHIARTVIEPLCCCCHQCCDNSARMCRFLLPPAAQGLR